MPVTGNTGTAHLDFYAGAPSNDSLSFLDLAQQFQAFKEQNPGAKKTLATSNGDSAGAPPADGAQMYIPQVSLPLFSESPEQAQLNDPNVEPVFNIDGIDASMQTPGSVNLYPSGSPSPLDIHLSGDLGNLFSAMAAHNPDFVKKMIQDNGDGTYTVHMHDPKGNPVDVTVNNQVPVGSNGNVVGGNNGQANWSNILLKACVKFNDLYHNLGSSAGQTGYAALKGGGDLEENVQALTGEQLGTFDSSDFSTQEKQDTLAKQMQQDINGGHVVFAADKDQTKGLYSVLEIHQNGNGRWYVDVGQGNGTITRMWMSDYVNSMHYTYISAKPVTPSGNNSLTSPESALAKLEDALQS